MKEYPINSLMDVLLDQIGMDFLGCQMNLDEEIKLYKDFVKLVEDGTKTTTVRFRRDKIRVPQQPSLPYIETDPANPNYRRDIGFITFSRLKIKTFGGLTDEDGKNDGFSSASELKEELQKIYGQIGSDELVSIYVIEKVWR